MADQPSQKILHKPMFLFDLSLAWVGLYSEADGLT